MDAAVTDQQNGSDAFAPLRHDWNRADAEAIYRPRFSDPGKPAQHQDRRLS